MKKRKRWDKRLYGVHMQRQLYDKNEFLVEETIRTINNLPDKEFIRVAQHVLAMAYHRKKSSVMGDDEKQ